MNIGNAYAPAAARRRRVIALHCSGASAGQWSRLLQHVFSVDRDAQLQRGLAHAA